ncbi:MAG: class I SAM-dependent methyltransferase [Peptostreptococcaceae bacterium]
MDVLNKVENGEYKLLLTPTKLVPKIWLDNISGSKVLCLASGGGQQGPIFAALGAEVTVFDNSNAQLSKDEMVAKRDNLEINLEQGDMRDLSRFENDKFDFIFHPVSNSFINNIEKTWNEWYRILISGFANPIRYIFDYYEWEEHNNLVVKNSIPYSDIKQLPKAILDKFIRNNETLEFGHSLQSQIGGQIDAGFVIAGFYEDKCEGDILDNYIDTYIATKAIKLK